MSAQAATISVTLTTFAASLGQDITKVIADFFAPRVIVGAGKFQFKKYDEGQAFRIYDTRLTSSGEPNLIEFDAADPSSMVDFHALGATISDQERQSSGDNGSQLEYGKISTLVTNWNVAQENRVVSYVEAQTTAESGAGEYLTDDAVDPIKEIDTLIKDISIATGMLPNALVMDIEMWFAIKNHPKVLARFIGNGNGTSTVTLAGFAALLLNPNIEIRLATIVKSTTKKGKAKANASVLGGGRLYVFHRNPNPTPLSNGWFSSFSTGMGNVNSVKFYRKPPFTDVYYVDMNYDIQLINSGAGKRIDLT